MNIPGKLASVVFGGNEICFQDENYSRDWEIRDVTDSCTSGDGEETALGRTTETFDLNGYLKDGSGARISCKALNFDFDGENYKAKDINMEESGNEIDVTDGGTTGNGTETLVGFVSRKSQFQFLMHDDVAEPAENDLVSTTITFATGVTVVGDFRFETYGDSIKVKDDAVGISQSGSWQGGITKNGLGSLNVGDEDTIAIIYKTGAGSNKERVGTAILLGITFTANYNDDLKVTYRFKVNGELTENQYAAS